MGSNIWSDCPKVPITQLLEFIVDNRGKTVPTAPNGHKLIATNCVTNNTLFPVYEKVRYLSDETYRTWFRAHPIPGDILFVNKGTPGRVCIVPDPIDFCIAQDMIALRADDSKIYNKYLFAVLRSREIQQQIYNTSVGDVIPHFKKQFMDQLLIPVPDRKEQEAIGDFYYALSYKVEHNKKLNDNLQQLLRVRFEDLFVINADEEWPTKKLGEYLSLERGLSYKGKFLSEDEGVPMLNLGNILPNSVFREEKLKFYTGEFKERHTVVPGDIIVANTDLTQAREVLGSAIRVPNLGYEAVICSHHISIVRNSKISNSFILGLLNMPEYRSRVAGFATGTTVLALPNETILNCEFQCPPIDVIKEYDDFADPVYAMMENIRIENHKLTSLRDKLLPQLMSGEINVSEVSL